jgi:hypothetical protein
VPYGRLSLKKKSFASPAIVWFFCAVVTPLISDEFDLGKGDTENEAKCHLEVAADLLPAPHLTFLFAFCW